MKKNSESEQQSEKEQKIEFKSEKPYYFTYEENDFKCNFLPERARQHLEFLLSSSPLANHPDAIRTLCSLLKSIHDVGLSLPKFAVSEEGEAGLEWDLCDCAVDIEVDGSVWMWAPEEEERYFRIPEDFTDLMDLLSTNVDRVS